MVLYNNVMISYHDSYSAPSEYLFRKLKVASKLGAVLIVISTPHSDKSMDFFDKFMITISEFQS